MIEGSFV